MLMDPLYIGTSKPSARPITAARKYQHSYQVRAGYWTSLIPWTEKSRKPFNIEAALQVRCPAQTLNVATQFIR